MTLDDVKHTVQHMFFNRAPAHIKSVDLNMQIRSLGLTKKELADFADDIESYFDIFLANADLSTCKLVQDVVDRVWSALQLQHCELEKEVVEVNVDYKQQAEYWKNKCSELQGMLDKLKSIDQ